MPTSPLSTQPHGVLSEWRQLGAYLIRPSLDVRPSSFGQKSSSIGMLARIFALDLAIMFVLLTILSALIAAGIELPRTAIADMEITIGLAALVVIAAPVFEELGFRSWLNGKPGWLVSLLILAVAGIGASMWGVSNTGDAATLGVAAIMIVAVVLCIIALFALRRRAAPKWFKTLFPGLFWLSAAGFALIHITNFADQAWWVVLPLVLPQFILGTLAAYVRIQIGLWAAIALHAAHNATMLGVATLATLVSSGANPAAG